MTQFALRPQAPLVHIIFLVTGKTSEWCIFIRSGRMTPPAWHVLMLAHQRQTADIVVELRLLPGTLVVTVLALPAFLIFVYIVFLVTAVAICFQMLLINITFVTGSALCLLMLEMQRIFCVFVMIEGDFFPAFFDVTGLAFFAKFSFMACFVIIFLMAAIACLGRILVVLLILVTRLALHIDVLTPQRVIRLAVIKAEFLPLPLVMTVRTFFTQPAFVDVIFLVTTITGARCIPVFFTRLVAILAFDLGLGMRIPQ